MVEMESEEQTPSESVEKRTPRERLLRLAKLSPIKRKLPRSTIAYGMGIVVAVAIIVLLAVVLGTSATHLLQSYADRLRDLIF